MEAGSYAWSRWNWSSWKETKNSPWGDTQTMRIEDHEEATSLFLEPVLAFFSHNRVDWMQERERGMILAPSGNRYQFDQVEQVMTTQFADDEIRNHDDRTGTTTSWEVPSMRTTNNCQEMKKC